MAYNNLYFYEIFHKYLQTSDLRHDIAIFPSSLVMCLQSNEFREETQCPPMIPSLQGLMR